MKNALKWLWRGAFLAVLPLMFACGSDDDGGAAGVAYTGSQTEATITASNAKTLASEAYVGGSGGSSLNVLGAVQAGGTNAQGQSRTFSLAKTLKSAVSQIDVASVAGAAAYGAVESGGPIPGDCPVSPGSFSYSISVNETTYAFSGTLSFSAFCSGGTTMSGTVTFSGQLNSTLTSFLNFQMSFVSLTTTTGNDSFTTSGSLSFIVSSATETTITMDLKLRDNTTTEVVWISNFTMTVTDYGSYEEVNISGATSRLYHFTHGYVTISSPIPLRVYSGNEWPSSGELVVTGANNRKVKLTAISDTQYEIRIDLDGIDGYELGPATYDWADI
ncbi:MAG: hypothetical protein IME96_01730 [Proteobacteria bacterium]|nr:hypothetical protein [Pseudomonadota bacterium]